MAMSPSTLLAKLDELKKWQQTQQERLMKMHNSRLEEAEREFSETRSEIALKHIEKPPESPSFNKPSSPVVIIRPSSPGNEKPKKPYLKRGTGLQKYGMAFGDHKKPLNKMKSSQPYKTVFHKRLEEVRKQERSQRNHTLNEESISESSVSKITPLKVPEVIVSNPSWVNDVSMCSPIYKETEESNNKSLHEEFKEVSVEIHEEPKNTQYEELDSNLLMILQKLAAEKFGNGTVDQSDVKFSFNETSLTNTPNKEELLRYLQNLVDKQEGVCQTPNLSSYEKALDRELQIFEQLEEKVSHHSFCSTSSSVLDLLGATPQRIAKVPLYDIIEESQNDSNSSNKSAKKMLRYEESQHSDYSENSENSSITSDDLIGTQEVYKERYERHQVIVKQNASTMTEPLEDGDELREKLVQLEKEISSFRVENRKLKRLKEECEKQSREVQKQKRALERKLQEDRAEMEDQLEEEKKKLQKERLVFEKYVKDNDKPSKKEREEITILKCELESLKETLKIKESKNGTCQARLRNQIKALEKENQLAKEELDKLHRMNAKLSAQQNNKKPNLETKMLHEINKNLTKLTQDAKVGKNLSKILPDEKTNSKKPTTKTPKPKTKSKQSKKTESLESQYAKALHRFSKSPEKEEEEEESEEISEDDTKSTTSNSSSSFHDYSRHSSSRRTSGRTNSEESHRENDQNYTNCDVTAFKTLSDLSLSENYNKTFRHPNAATTTLKRHNSLNDTQQTTSKVEIVQPDGSRETKYPNGNVKTTSVDGNVIRMVYFNGDIKETRLLDRIIKYFYKESNVWQSTLPNGDEIFEYPDGQVEKHFADGTSHVQYPNGIVKHVDAEGTEKINYPDGSVATIMKNGDKILILPNGQKEIHTETSKRRDYPDGTVKIIYPDGLQETRYSNGRIRMKDKEGTLIMDSHRD